MRSSKGSGNSRSCAPSQKHYTCCNEICPGNFGLFDHSPDFGRWNFIARRGQAVAAHHRWHRIRRCIRQARLHDALNFAPAREDARPTDFISAALEISSASPPEFAPKSRCLPLCFPPQFRSRRPWPARFLGQDKPDYQGKSRWHPARP
jgi:hypothetical protein